MGHILGIDLGTTNSCMAVFSSSEPQVLPNAEGARTTPSVVAYAADGSQLVGVTARRQAVPYQLVAGPSDAVRIQVGDEELSPEQVSALTLAKLKADAEAYLGEEVTQAVITVPAYFNDAQRSATKDAAKIAGLEVLRLVNEPTAAALAYGLRDSEEKTVLVFDLGGGTFDVSVLELGDGIFEVRATQGDNHLGGDDFDQLLVAHLAQTFKAEHGIDLLADASAVQRLTDAAEAAKIELSSAPQTHISLPFLSANQSGPLHFELTLKRSEMEELVQPLLDRLREPVAGAIEAAGKTAADIDEVLLVGGMTRMPAVQRLAEELSGRPPLRGINPDEAVALGAAVQAAVLSGEVGDVVLLDVIPLSLGIETRGGVMTRLLPANSTIPTKVTETFTTGDDNQASVEVHVLQGERELAADNRSLGHVQLLGVPPAPAGVPQIEVTFAVDADGILDVSARDLGTGAQQELRIEASTGLSDRDIERMRNTAALNREEDVRRRQLIEQQNDAHALRLQARRVLELHGERLPEELREQLTEAIGAVEAQEKTGNLEALAEAFAGLQDAVADFSRALYAEPADEDE